jgi:hypothetical protein
MSASFKFDKKFKIRFAALTWTRERSYQPLERIPYWKQSQPSSQDTRNLPGDGAALLSAAIGKFRGEGG